MHDTRFIPAPASLRLDNLARLVGARLVRGDPATLIGGAAPLETAQQGELTFLDNAKYARYLTETQAAACLCQARYVDRLPPHVAALETSEPYRAYSVYMAFAYPSVLKPTGMFGLSNLQGQVHPEALLEPDVAVEPGAVVGARAEIGRGTVIAAGAVVGEAVPIGRDCQIGSNAVVQHSLIGDRVRIHPGASIGHDGFGFAMGKDGHSKVAQTGRVIVQDDVEIGANSVIARGANRDTVLGHGTKLGDGATVGHNVEIGRHCIIVSQVAIAGSVHIGDFVVIGGRTVINGHLSIGDGAQIAGASVVHGDVPPNVRWGGMPARPAEDWFRELAATRRRAFNRSRRSTEQE